MLALETMPTKRTIDNNRKAIDKAIDNNRKRKVGSGRKCHPNSLTSTDYMHQLAVLEFEWKTKATATVSEKEEFTRNKRRLKNRMSALKSRERKREKLNELESTIAQLTEEVQRLQAENIQLKRMRVTSDTESEDSKANRSELFQEQPKSSSTNSLTCAHKNGGSAVSPTRNSPIWAAQYTHLLWVMPWTNLHLMLSTIWTVTSRSTLNTSLPSNEDMNYLSCQFFVLISNYLLCSLFSKYCSRKELDLTLTRV